MSCFEETFDSESILIDKMVMVTQAFGLPMTHAH